MTGTLSERTMRKLFISLYPAQALSVGLPALCNLLTTIIVGNFLGSEALASIGFVGPMTSCIAIIVSILTIGSQMLCGQYLGEGNEDQLHRCFNTTMLMCLAAGLLLTLLSSLFPRSIAVLLGSAGVCLSDTADYVRGFGLGLLFNTFSSGLLPFLYLENRQKRATAAVAAMMLGTVGFNLFNALVLHWRLFGAGLSLSFGSLLMVATELPYFLFRSHLFRLDPHLAGSSYVAPVLRLGLSSGTRSVCLMFRDRIVNGVIFAVGGVTGMAALTVGMNICTSISCAFEGGYAGSGRLLASFFAGERDGDALKLLPRVMAHSAWYLNTLVYALIFVFARPLAFLLGADAENVSLFAAMIRTANIWLLSNLFVNPPFIIYQAMDRLRLLTLFNFLNCFAFPVAYVLVARRCGASLPVLGLYPFAGEVLILISFVCHYALSVRRLPRSLLDTIVLSEDFIIPAERRFGCSVRTEEKAVVASREAAEFCRKSDLPSRTAYFCSLCIEEMLMFTLQNSFPHRKTDGLSVDLRLVREDDGLTILLRDNCPYLDPDEWLALYEPKEPMKSVGVRMVKTLSREMRYSRAFGLNVLTIRL